ncbi:hypothetical protein [Brevundimonas bullata]
MAFRLRNDAEKWFSELDGKEPTKTKFDLYYFCVMAGLASGRSSDPSAAGVGTKEFMSDFIQDYKPAQRLLLGLLVVAEVKRGGIDLDEKAAVREVFKRLVTPNASTNLTDEGMRCMNAYASGGYEFLAEQRDTKPASAQEFLRDYVALIDEAARAAA